MSMKKLMVLGMVASLVLGSVEVAACEQHTEDNEVGYIEEVEVMEEETDIEEEVIDFSENCTCKDENDLCESCQEMYGYKLSDIKCGKNAYYWIEVNCEDGKEYYNPITDEFFTEEEVTKKDNTSKEEPKKETKVETKQEEVTEEVQEVIEEVIEEEAVEVFNIKGYEHENSRFEAMFN